MASWHRTFNIVKEVSKGQVLLRIPFYTIPVQDLNVESWHFTKEGNELFIRLERKEERCLLEKMLEEKQINYERFLAYPGEKLR